jgi:hypothetical protein
MNVNIQGMSGCSFGATGNVTVSMTGFSTSAVCVADATNGSFAVATQQGTPITSSVNVLMQSSPGVFVNGSFTLICVGS